MIRITINDQKIEVAENKSILEVALDAGIYIPHLCYHPQLESSSDIRSLERVYQGALVRYGEEGASFDGCNLCLVEIQGREGLFQSCKTIAEDGMSVRTDSNELHQAREENLATILERHPHACLLCAQAEGCDRKICSLQVPEPERCCFKFGFCELQKVSEFIGLEKGLPPYNPLNVSVVDNEPLIIRDYNLCVGCLRCVKVCTEVKGADALGFTIEEGRVVVGSKEPTLTASGCQFCGFCVEVCPTGALADKAVALGEPETYLIPCKNSCPAGIDIPGYIRLIADGKVDEANAVIRQKVPFPGILGRVCIRPCEDVCRRSDVNEAISICALKRFAADNNRGLWKGSIKLKGDSGRRVAIIGSGPAGLTAAFYLKECGHHVTVFEAMPLPGGMMRYGIPDYRLPLPVVEKEIQDILELGIELKTGKTLGKDFAIDDLKDEGYEAIFLAVGSQLSRKIELEGSDLTDVLWGVDFLFQVKGGKGVKLKDRVVVIGGGNVAIDVALTALRCGANSVTLACLEKRDEMPADEWEIDQAIEEGVEILTAWGPNKMLNKDAQVTGIELKGCASVFDSQGNFSPTYDERIKELETDQVILAIGQASDLSFITSGSPITVQSGLIAVDQESLETGMQGVFAGGDLTKTPGAIIHAIVAGRTAASSIDRLLGGDGDIEETLFQPEPLSPTIGRIEGFASLARERVPELPVADRHKGFTEVALGFDLEHARKEASRCLQCDLRFHIKPVVLPPERWLNLAEEAIEGLPEEDGVYVLYDENKDLHKVCGVENIRQALLQEYGNGSVARYFTYEVEPMFTTRERQLIQQYMKRCGKMPPGNEELDELF